MLYVDFEALVIPTRLDHPERGDRTFEYETQTPCSVGYYIVSTFGNSTSAIRHGLGSIAASV